jgi:hypothetical protein
MPCSLARVGNVSEEHNASNIRVEEEAKQKTSVNQAARRTNRDRKDQDLYRLKAFESYALSLHSVRVAGLSHRRSPESLRHNCMYSIQYLLRYSALSVLFLLPYKDWLSSLLIGNLKHFFFAIRKATDYGVVDQGVRFRVPVRSRILFSPCRPDRFWGPTSLSNRYQKLFSPGVKRPGREADRSPQMVQKLRKRGTTHPFPICRHAVVPASPPLCNIQGNRKTLTRPASSPPVHTSSNRGLPVIFQTGSCHGIKGHYFSFQH